MVNPLQTWHHSQHATHYGIARNHPFVDGNKRTALVAARTFLLLNGVNVQAAQVDKWLTFLELAKGSLTEPELGVWIRSRMVEDV